MKELIQLRKNIKDAKKAMQTALTLDEKANAKHSLIEAQKRLYNKQVELIHSGKHFPQTIGR